MEIKNWTEKNFKIKHIVKLFKSEVCEGELVKDYIKFIVMRSNHRHYTL